MTSSARNEGQAFQGNALSQFSIAKAFGAGGDIVPRDAFRAYFWATLAAAHGVNGAARFSEKIASHMTAQQIGEARSLATSWKPMTAEDWKNHNDEIVRRMATIKTVNPASDKARISNIGNVPRNIDIPTDEWCGFHESNMDLRREPRRSAAELNPHKTKPPSGI